MVEKTIDDVQLIFTSTTGRSGTRYLANLFNANALNATAEHDPYPRGYGDPILWYDIGEEHKLKVLASRKLERLERGLKNGKFYSQGIAAKISGRERAGKLYIPFHRFMRSRVPSVEIKEVYLESTHAFTKSFGEAICLLVPEVKIIHLTRNPLEVAKSFFNRNSIPGPDNPFLLSPGLKRNELNISTNMTNFQKCFWYWFECELRHVKFLEEHDITKVYDIDIKELNDKEKVEELFRFLAIKHRDLHFGVDRNKNKMITELTEKDIDEAKELLKAIPGWVFDRIGDTYDIQNKIL